MVEVVAKGSSGAVAYHLRGRQGPDGAPHSAAAGPARGPRRDRHRRLHTLRSCGGGAGQLAVVHGVPGRTRGRGALGERPLVGAARDDATDARLGWQASTAVPLPTCDQLASTMTRSKRFVVPCSSKAEKGVPAEGDSCEEPSTRGGHSRAGDGERRGVRSDGDGFRSRADAAAVGAVSRPSDCTNGQSWRIAVVADARRHVGRALLRPAGRRSR